MRKLLILMMVICGSFLVSSCVVHAHGHPPKPPKHHKHKPLPPGKVKKMKGPKSAKPYAPGQLKKHPHSRR